MWRLRWRNTKPPKRVWKLFCHLFIPKKFHKTAYRNGIPRKVSLEFLPTYKTCLDYKICHLTKMNLQKESYWKIITISEIIYVKIIQTV